MEKNPGNPEKGSEFNKIDLSALQDFSFGTEWSPATDPSEVGSTERRERRRESGPGAGRDRRPPRQFPPRDDQAGRSAGPRERGDRFQRGGPGREGGPRPDRRGPPRDSGGHESRRPIRDYAPYESRTLEVAFYPEEHGFNALVKAMRNSCRTYELFEIARLILEKVERSVVVYRRHPLEDGSRPDLAVSVPDGLPFESEDEAIQHVLAHHMDKFFEIAEVETDPPKGNFQIVHRCPVTRELLGPPNYHRYAAIVEQHHAARASHIPLERYKGSLISSREPEDIQAWLDKMKKAIRYTSKPDLAEESGTFDSPEEARAYLLRVARAKMVKTAEATRIDAREVQKYPETEAARAMEGALERQRRFPLDTANALRGRLRRENFHIFKRGSKGITLACAVRRKYRVPGQVFADSVEKLIGYIEANPLTPIGALPEKFLGIAIHAGPDGSHEDLESLPEDKKDALKKMAMDLRWLVTEGYVAEFSDGRLLAAPAEGRQPQAPAANVKTKSKTAKPEKKAEGPDKAEVRPAAAGAAAGVVVTGEAEPAAGDSAPVAEDPEAEAGSAAGEKADVPVTEAGIEPVSEVIEVAEVEPEISKPAVIEAPISTPEEAKPEESTEAVDEAKPEDPEARKG
ncbi:MAG: hypothetical protein R3F07_08900 [Opitutaceae bacterium]